MKRAMKLAAVMAGAATSVAAGGIERTNQSVGLIFEKGNVAELSFGVIDPSVTGVATAAAATPGVASGDIGNRYTRLGFGYKHQFSDTLSFALIYDQPYGADAAYPASTYFLTGTNAQVTSHALTGVLKYTTENNVSVFAGARYQTLDADAAIPTFGGGIGYTAASDYDGEWGYLVGAAYEIPEIALRVALTYNSAIDYSGTTSETGPVTLTSPTTTSTPQSVNLDFQSGINKNTLVFGSVRWVDWSEFVINPPVYAGATSTPLVSYSGDYTNYTLGVARRFNEKWAGRVSVSYEDPLGDFRGNLGPIDGRTGIALGVSYKPGDGMEISGGISYVWIGDTPTTSPTLAPGTTAANFNDNSVVGAGVRIRYTF